MTARMVVITGAGGFVCSQIAVELAAAGFDVIGVDQLFDAPTVQRLASVRRVCGALADALQGLTDITPSAVIHGAAITASPAAFGISAAAHIRRNTDMLTGCLDWARAAGARQFVFLSSSGVFCAADGSDTLTETAAATARGPYSAAKKAGEILTQGAADESFVTVSLRLGNVFGAVEAMRPTRPGVGLVARMIAAAKSDRVIRVETSDARRDWTWLPDIGRALGELLLAFPPNGVDLLHCGNPEILSDLELANAIAALVPGTRIEVNRGPVAATKGPMGSRLVSALSRFHWTPVHDGLAALLQAEAAP